TLLPANPTTNQQGCLMTGGCSLACGSTFHNFVVVSDSITVTDVLLCSQVALSGPGNIYQLRFHARSSPPTTTPIFLRRATVFNDGVAVPTIRGVKPVIGVGVGRGVDPPATHGFRELRVEPNPAYGHVRFVLDGDTGGSAEADVVDLLGRIVRHLGPFEVG